MERFIIIYSTNNFFSFTMVTNVIFTKSNIKLCKIVSPSLFYTVFSSKSREVNNLIFQVRIWTSTIKIFSLNKGHTNYFETTKIFVIATEALFIDRIWISSAIEIFSNFTLQTETAKKKKVPITLSNLFW